MRVFFFNQKVLGVFCKQRAIYPFFLLSLTISLPKEQPWPSSLCWTQLRPFPSVLWAPGQSLLSRTPAWLLFFVLQIAEVSSQSTLHAPRKVWKIGGCTDTYLIIPQDVHTSNKFLCSKLCGQKKWYYREGWTHFNLVVKVSKGKEYG